MSRRYSIAEARDRLAKVCSMAAACCRPRRSAARSKYLLEVVAPTVPILAYDASAAEWHASERARLTRLGRTPPFVDGQIAAVARLNGLEVVTTNVEDYLDFEGITVRDWRS